MDARSHHAEAKARKRSCTSFGLQEPTQGKLFGTSIHLTVLRIFYSATDRGGYHPDEDMKCLK